MFRQLRQTTVSFTVNTKLVRLDEHGDEFWLLFSTASKISFLYCKSVSANGYLTTCISLEPTWKRVGSLRLPTLVTKNGALHSQTAVAERHFCS